MIADRVVVPTLGGDTLVHNQRSQEVHMVHDGQHFVGLHVVRHKLWYRRVVAPALQLQPEDVRSVYQSHTLGRPCRAPAGLTVPDIIIIQ